MNFVFFSAMLWDWSDGATPSVCLAHELARRGHRVLFVQPRMSVIRDHPGENIRIITLEELGLEPMRAARAWYGLDSGPLETVAENLVAQLAAMGRAGEPCIAVWFASFVTFARLLPTLRARSWRLIYYPLDDYPAMVGLGHPRQNVQVDTYLTQQADLVVTVSKPIAEKLRRNADHVQIIPNGVKLDEFQNGALPADAPVDILRGERTLGFWGYLQSAMADLELLTLVARTRPNWALNLIGVYEPEFASLQQFPNVRLHGYVAHLRLKDYGAQFDVCLLPAPDNDMSRGRDSLKVYEYLAVHKPVVCAYMPQVEGMPYVHNASSPQEFIAQIESALAEPMDRARVDEFLQKQTWSARADCLLELVGPMVHTPRAKISESDAPPPFGESKTGWEPYAAALEKELEETQRWAKELETAAVAQEHLLQRLYRLPPVRVARKLKQLLRPTR